MSSIAHIISSGLAARRLQLDVIANNIANINSTGFAASLLVTQDRPYSYSPYLAGHATDAGDPPEPLWMGNGVQAAAVQRSLDHGPVRETGRTLDLVISGEGFFALEAPDGTKAYTRDGAFTVDSQGALVNAQGWRLVPTVTVPADAIAIEVRRDGTVYVTRGTPPAPEAVGAITLTTFASPAGLQSLGNNLLRATDASGAGQAGPAASGERGDLLSGFLEGSNVDFGGEMVRLVQAQHAYQLNVRLMQTWGEMESLAANLRR